MGHDMMLDTDWRKVADRIDAWVQEHKAARAERELLVPRQLTRD
jgi:hypothetical protein